MKNFAVLTNYARDKDMKYTRQVADYLQQKGCSVWIPEELWKKDTGMPYYELSQMPSDVECVIVLGGDGTILNTARKLEGMDIPIFSINIGTLGFLLSAEASECPSCLDCLFDGSYVTEKRMMLQGRVFCRNKMIRENIALNDIIIERSGFSRLVEIKVYVNEELLTIYEADGVIVSTPTGSTAYSLSAGGPIAYPNTDVIIVTPICPHSLYARSIVISGNDRVKVEIGKRRKTQKEEAIVTFDGDISEKLETADRVEIVKSAETVTLLKQKGIGFYQVLQNKIGGM